MDSLLLTHSGEAVWERRSPAPYKDFLAFRFRLAYECHELQVLSIDGVIDSVQQKKVDRGAPRPRC
jgi:hypothetical protein